MADDFKALIAKVATGASMTRDEAASAFDRMMSGEATPSQMGGLLMAMRVRGESVDEITGAVTTMRAKMLGVKAPAGAIDVVGTGGDASGSYNISTCAAFIVAGCGVPVAKHGNRALSSKSGAADVLQALGVKIDLAPQQVARCIGEAGIGFMFAPAHHPAMKNVGPTRVELGTRTIFNLLGPISNPAGAKRQLVGVFAPNWVKPVAEVRPHKLPGAAAFGRRHQESYNGDTTRSTGGAPLVHPGGGATAGPSLLGGYCLRSISRARDRNSGTRWIPGVSGSSGSGACDRQLLRGRYTTGPTHASQDCAAAGTDVHAHAIACGAGAVSAIGS